MEKFELTSRIKDGKAIVTLSQISPDKVMVELFDPSNLKSLGKKAYEAASTEEALKKMLDILDEQNGSSGVYEAAPITLH